MLRFGEQAEAQGIETIEHSVGYARFQLAELGRDNAFSAEPVVEGSAHAVPHAEWVGPDGVETLQTHPRHLDDALPKVVFGRSEGVGHVPTPPVGKELIEKTMIEPRVLGVHASDLLVVPHLARQIDRAADAVFRDENRLPGGGVAQIPDLRRKVRIPLIRMRVEKRVTPRRLAGIAQRAESLPRHFLPRNKLFQTAVEHRYTGLVQRVDQRQHGHRMTKDRPIAGLVQQPPHHHAGMISVAADHAADRRVEPFRHLRRILPQPIGRRLIVNQETDFIAEIELIASRDGAEKPDHVEPHHLAVQQIATKHIGVEGDTVTDRHRIAGMRTLQEDPFAV